MTIKKSLDVTENLILFYEPSNGQHSIRASKYHPIDSILHIFSPREYVQNPTYLSVQVDGDKHIHLFPEFLQYINHSCEPNTFFDTSKGEIIVIKAINENEEVTFFYPSTEWRMEQTFTCHCGSPNCIGIIEGAASLSKEQLHRYKINHHILTMLDK